jgi:DNA replication protein DnaC
MKNRTVETLGLKNKSTLRKIFREELGLGKKASEEKIMTALGVDDKNEMYKLMALMLNEKIETDKQIKERQQKEMKIKVKKINKQDRAFKKAFKNVLGEIKQRKQMYNVAISIEEKKVYKDNNKEYYGSTLIQKTYLVSNDTALESKIDDDITGYYPYEDSSYTVYLVSYKYNISEAKTLKVGPLDVPMKRGKPYKASFLQHADKIDPMSYEDYNDECVLKMLQKHMNIKKEETLIKYFNQTSHELYDRPYHKNYGITSRMILYLCKQRNISCLGFDQRNKNFVKHTADHSKKRKFKPIIFYMFVTHFYIITDHDLIMSLSATFRNNNNIFHSTLDNTSANEDTEEVTYYSDLPVSEVIELPKNSVVIYDKTDLMGELREYIELTHDIPKVKNNTITHIGKILLPNKVQMVISGCLGEGIEWGSIQNICNKTNIKFKNQSLGNMLCELRDKFFVMKRATFTQKQREIIKTEQDNKCNKCKDVISNKFHIDHIKPISSGGSNERSNLQALCVSCHVEKSREEKEACEYIQTDNITSAFNIGANSLIESEYFRKVAFTQPLKECAIEGYGKYAKDMNKCRRNLLINYKYDFPRYSVLDDIENFDGTLGIGFYYIESENTFPLRKNGFYAFPMVDYCLKNRIITKQDIKYQFKPSFCIPSDYFKNFIEYLDDIFDGDGFLKKLAVNSLVGLFGRRKNTFIETRLCDRNEMNDIACAYQDFHTPYLNIINDKVIQVAGQNEIKKIESTFPIHAQILDCEAIELHKLVTKIRERGGFPYEIKTDAVSYYAEDIIELDDCWDKEKTLPKYKDEEAKDIIRAVNINNEEFLQIYFHQYKRHQEDDDYVRLAKTLVDSNKGCLILGPAGTGKTFLVNEIKKQMIEKGLYVKCLAPTNKASLLLNGETLHKFSYALLNNKKSVGKYKADVLMVDEISMMSELFYQVLVILKNHNPNMKIFMVGDFGQLPPVNDRVNKNYKKCRALYELVDGYRLDLTRCKRSDDVHFNNCMNVRKGLAIDISKFPNTEETYLNVCYTNKCRKAVNDYYMKKYLLKHNNVKTLAYEPLGYDKNTQKMTIGKGMPIMARVNDTGLDIVNNELFTVADVTDENITISNEIKSSIVIPAGKFHKLFSLAFCITIHKSQGATFDGRYTIYEWDKLDRKLKYVALSRATDEKNVQIVETNLFYQLNVWKNSIQRTTILL